MWKLIPSPPSSTQMNLTQLERDVLSPPPPIRHSPIRNSVEDRFRRFADETSASSGTQTLTQIAAGSPPRKRRQFFPPIRGRFDNEGASEPAAKPEAKTSERVVRILEKYQVGEFVLASDVHRAKKAVLLEGPSKIDDRDDDDRQSRFDSQEKRSSLSSTFERNNKQRPGFSSQNLKELASHPFSTQKKLKEFSASSFKNNLSEIDDVNQIREKRNKECGNSQFDSWLERIESIYTRGKKNENNFGETPSNKLEFPFRQAGDSFANETIKNKFISGDDRRRSRFHCKNSSSHGKREKENQNAAEFRDPSFDSDFDDWMEQYDSDCQEEYYANKIPATRIDQRNASVCPGFIRSSKTSMGHHALENEKSIEGDDDSSHSPRENFGSNAIPMGESPPSVRNPAQVPTSSVPTPFRSIFAFPFFNAIQSKAFADVFRSSRSIVVSAPTGSGKTALFELAVVRLATKTFNCPSVAVYLAPTKALCGEKYDDWRRRFVDASDRLSCHLMTGDSEVDVGSSEFLRRLRPGNVCVVIATPEKWDVMTRNWRSNEEWVRHLRLVLIDEVHHLGDVERGPKVEAVVSRMKIIDDHFGSQDDGNSDRLRFVAVSATIPNIEDVASWLGNDSLPAAVHWFGNEYRPVKLRHVVLSFPPSDSKYLFDRNLSYKLKKIIDTYSDNKPTLVFCTTRKMTELSASELAKGSKTKLRDLESITSLENDKLKRLLSFGVGFHHAGLSYNDRREIETLFLQNRLPVLVSTSTLSTGVNLPAHLVVLKSTFRYVNTGYAELDENQVLQMIGRAGRPQFDKTATVVIMTQHSTRSKYEMLLQGNQLVESSFHKDLVENINAEVSLSSINSVDEAVRWVKTTFYYRRFLRDPGKYGISIDTGDPLIVDRELQRICREATRRLAGIDCVAVTDHFDMSSTPIGKLMAKHCISFETMSEIFNLQGTESFAELLSILSRAKEFRDVAVRQAEKSYLNRLSDKKNPECVRFPLSSKIKSNDQKVFVLLQAALGGIYLNELSLSQESFLIFKSAPRISTCLMEFLLVKRKDYKLSLHGIYLAKCIRARLWENSPLVMKQLRGIGDKMAQILVDAGYDGFDKIAKAEPRLIESILNRAPPFGNGIVEKVKRLPFYGISASTLTPFQGNKAKVKITASLLNKTGLSLEKSTAGRYHSCVLLVGDAENHIIYQRRVYDSDFFKSPNDLFFVFGVDRAAENLELQIHFLSTEFVGLDVWFAIKPVYSDLNSSSGESSLGEASFTMSSEKKAEEKSVDSETFNNKKKSQPLPVCGHHCSNKQKCKHECCKAKIDGSGMRQQSISKFFSRADVVELKSKSSQMANNVQPDGNSSLQSDSSLTSKIFSKMTKQFSFRPLQKVSPMIRTTSSDVPPASSSPPPLHYLTNDQTTTKTVNSTHNHLRASAGSSTKHLDSSHGPRRIEENSGEAEGSENHRDYDPKQPEQPESPAMPSLDIVRSWASSPIQSHIEKLQEEMEYLKELRLQLQPVVEMERNEESEMQETPANPETEMDVSDAESVRTVDLQSDGDQFFSQELNLLTNELDFN